MIMLLHPRMMILILIFQINEKPGKGGQAGGQVRGVWVVLGSHHGMSGPTKRWLFRVIRSVQLYREPKTHPVMLMVVLVVLSAGSPGGPKWR